VDELGASAGRGTGPSLGGFHLYHAIRADLLRRLGRAAEAAAAYDEALARTANAAEQDFLRRQRASLSQPT
jgi:RNA polymerase sigma-70 factor (ECF subfamily)